MNEQQQSITPKPFLKWAGGKRKSAAEIIGVMKTLVPRGGFQTCHIPFLGGGGVFFAMRAMGARAPARGFCLSDLNGRLVSTYQAIRENHEAVLTRLDELATAHDKEHYYQQRARSLDGAIDEEEDVEIAAWFLYLNRTCFNGLWRENKRGMNNVPMGKYKKPFNAVHSLVRAAAPALQGVPVYHCDFREVSIRVQSGDVVYFDPPYVPLDDTANFTAYTRAGFGPDERAALRDLAVDLAQKGAVCLLSDHDTEQIRELYDPHKGFIARTIMVPRAINSKGEKRGEVPELLVSIGG